MDSLEQVADVSQIQAAQEAIREIYVDRLVHEYAVNLARAARDHGDVYLGASPRGSLSLYRGGQALASMRGRAYMIPDDVKDLAVAVLSHWVILSPAARIRSVDTRGIVQEVVGELPVPGASAA